MTLQDNILPAIAGIAILLLVARSIWQYEAEYYDDLKKSARGPVRPSGQSTANTPPPAQNGSIDPEIHDDIVLDDEEKETIARISEVRTRVETRIAALQALGLEIVNSDKVNIK